MTDADNFLEHYGVRGMRWGKRRSSDTTGASSDSSKKAKVKAIALSAAALGVVGAVVVMKALDKHGSLSTSNLSMKPVTDAGKRLVDSKASTRFDAKTRFDPHSFELPKQQTPTFNMNPTPIKTTKPASSPKPPTAPKVTAPPSRPKPPSQYPNTPIIPTPILDEIMRKYGL